MSLLTPITLPGQHATLIPLKIEHCEELKKAVQDGELGNLWYTRVPLPQDMEAEILRRLDLQKQGTMLPFVVINNQTKQIVGMTTFCNMDLLANRLEIGFTWYSKSVQKTSLNTECKLMLLSHAFEVINCIAVEFRTSAFNLSSRKAIERLGAKLDGVLRNHRVFRNGIVGDSCIYSILNSEWLGVKANLQFKLTSFDN